MSNAKNRVQIERSEVMDRLAGLHKFLDPDNDAREKVGSIQHGLLAAQLQIMRAYVAVLDMRLEQWEPE